MTDSLNIFIQKHRDAFDAAVPGAHGWPGLERMLERLPDSDVLERQIMCDRVLLDTAMPSDLVWAGIEKDLDRLTQHTDLESFIHQNREAFDAEMPSGQAWENISQSLPKPKAIKVHIGWQRSIMRIAASLVLLVVGIGGGIWYERQGGHPSGMAMSEVSGEYAELEQFYQRGISVKQEKLATFTGNQAAEVGEDLEQLDVIMEQLQLELANVPPGNREQVVRAMINNYKAKMAILQRVLEHLEKSNNGGDNSKQSNGIKNI
ncbi:MAG: hypothetical protein IPH31_12810 [Lewinellaceae bacterium]|nr:hypothetical protein [Lewinellaceae bacterium]